MLRFLAALRRPIRDVLAQAQAPSTAWPRELGRAECGGIYAAPSAASAAVPARNARRERSNKILSTLAALAGRPLDLSQHPRLPAQPAGPRGRQPEGHGRDGHGSRPRPGRSCCRGCHAGPGRRRRPGGRAAHARLAAWQRKPGDPWLLIAQAQVQHADRRSCPARLGLLDNAVAGATRPQRAAIRALSARPRQLQPRQLRPGGRRFRRALWPAAPRCRTRLEPMLWRYAAQVHGAPRCARRARQDRRQREPLRMAGPDRQVPAGPAVGRRARGRGRIRRRRQADQRQVSGRLLRRHRRRAARRQAARARAAPARPGPLPDRVRVNWALERAQAA